MSLQSAIGQELKRRAQTNAQNEAIQQSIGEPERGSHMWWVKLCRQNTGQHALDSGIAYGYQYNRRWKTKDEDPCTLEFDCGKSVSGRIHLPAFLDAMFDPSGDEAEAAEELLHWCGNWLTPNESWAATAAQFVEELETLRDCFYRRGYDTICFKRKEYRKRVLEHRAGLGPYDVMRFQSEMTHEEYADAAMDAFPVEAAKLVWDEEMTGNDVDMLGPFYTYNDENDFDQDWLVDTWLNGGFGAYAVIRTHNGCDARGGFSRPVVAYLNDYADEYVYSWQLDCYCQECHEGRGGLYRYHKAIGEMPSRGEEDIMGAAAASKNYSDGQEPLPGFEKWPYEIPVDQAKAVARFLDEQAEYYEQDDWDGLNIPVGLIQNDDDEWFAPDAFGYDRQPAMKCALRCPSCGSYAVRVYNPVYGY